jgi:hypothetical protein
MIKVIVYVGVIDRVTALEFRKQLGLIMLLSALRKEIVWGDTNGKRNPDIGFSIDFYCVHFMYGHPAEGDGAAC